ncbi:hypothetical protein [Pseudomonas sp. AIG]
MRHVLGLYTPKNIDRSWLLDDQDLIAFNTDSFHSHGYFSLIASAFEQYAQRDAGIGIGTINVKFQLKRDDLDDALEILNNLETERCQRPARWREHLGTVHYPGQPVRPVQPLLFRSRVLRLVRMLQALVHKAKAGEKWLVYGSGVCYRALRGIKLPPGIEEYS